MGAVKGDSEGSVGAGSEKCHRVGEVDEATIPPKLSWLGHCDPGGCILSCGPVSQGTERRVNRAWTGWVRSTAMWPDSL